MKKTVIKTLIAAFALVAMISCFLLAGNSAGYDDYNESIKKRDELIAQNEKLESELDRINKEIGDMHSELIGNIQASGDLTLKEQSYTALLNTCLQQLSSERELLAVTEELISSIDTEIITLEDRKVYLEDSLVKTVRNLQENGGLGYIEFLLGSTDIIDFLNRYEYVTSILDYHDTLLRDVEKTNAELTAKKAECLELKSKQEETLALLESRRIKYDEIISECMNELSALSSDSLLLEELIKLKENDMTKVENEIKDVLASLDNVNQDINDFGYNNWFWPGDDKYITSYYGGREVEGSKNYHKGIDINLRYENVYAARAGTVITAKYSNSYGYYIVIDHGNKIQTLYAHLSKLDVKVGQKVGARELIGVSGNTGWSTGPHLHFEIRVNGSQVNPLKAKSVGITGMSSYLNLPD